MPTPVHAAARHLRGHLVDTPVIGDIRLSGFPVTLGVCVKVECLQTAGSAWYRGYLHYMLRSLGRFKGIVLHGDPLRIAAQTLAGEFHRLPMFEVSGDDPGALAQEKGFHLLPGADDPDVSAGIATLGLELADQLPAEVGRVVLTAGAFVGPVREGFAAADRACDVLAVGTSAGTVAWPPEWPDAMARGLRVVTDDAGRSALWQERESELPTCVVI